MWTMCVHSGHAQSPIDSHKQAAEQLPYVWGITPFDRIAVTVSNRLSCGKETSLCQYPS